MKPGPAQRKAFPEGKELIEALRRYFAEQPDVVAAYLFGSRATGRARPGSDVDTAVLLLEEDGLARFYRRLGLMDGVSEVCGREADVIVLNDAPHCSSTRCSSTGSCSSSEIESRGWNLRCGRGRFMLI